MTKPTAAYLRLSVLTDDSVSIDGQSRLVRAEAERRGWPAPAIFSDPGVSGSKDVRRPQRDDLERRIAAGEFGALIVKSVDRLARSTIDFHRIAATARAADCALVVTDLGLDTSTPVGEMVLGILAQIAAFEVRMTGDRVRVSNDVRVSAGRAIGGPVPYGFRNVQHAEKPGTYRVVDPDEAPLVRRIVADLIAGHSLHAIARALQRQGTRSPRAADAERNGREPEASAWDSKTIHRIASNPAIAGMTRRLGDLVRDNSTGLPRVDPDEAIIDLATFRRVQEVLRQRAEGAKRRTPHAERLLLDGIAVCEGCGRTLKRSSSKGGTRASRYVMYSCGAGSKNRCSRPATATARLLDEHVIADLLTTFGHWPITRHVPVADTEKTARLAEVHAAVAETAAGLPSADPASIPALAERLVALRKTEDALLRELESEPHYEAVPTGRTFAEEWAEANAGGVDRQRDVIASLVGEVEVSRATVTDPDGKTRRLSLAERVVIWGPDDLARDPARHEN